MEYARSARVWAMVLLVTAAFISSGCHVEQRADGKWWVCGTAQTASGPIYGCQPLDVYLASGR